MYIIKDHIDSDFCTCIISNEASCIKDHIDSDFLKDEMPSAPYQKQIDNIVEFDWLVSLLTEVVETTFDWISKNGEKWMIHDNKGTMDQQSDIYIRHMARNGNTGDFKYKGGIKMFLIFWGKIISNGEEGKECHFHILNQSREDMKEIQKVEKRRIVKSTFCNERSSKSHCMIILDVPIVGGRLILVDMAGSENIEQAGQTGFEAKMQIAIYTISTWSRTVMEKIKQLIGRSAPPDFLAKLTYLIWIHHETLCCREDMLLNKAHKIGEMLQEKIEQLAEVERAFFHIDFESSVTSQT
ncbi:kinesin-like protein KIN-10A [Tanacetum coccineum]